MASLSPARPAGGVPFRLFAGSAVALTLSACTSTPDSSTRAAVDPAAGCSALMAPVPASAIGLPSGGALIESATLMPATASR